MSSDNTQLPTDTKSEIFKILLNHSHASRTMATEELAELFATKLHQAQQDTKQAKQLLFRLASLVNAEQSPDDIFLTEIQTFLDGE